MALTENRVFVALASVRLSLWLLLASAALFFFGSNVTGAHYELFSKLNQTPLQNWLFAEGRAHLSQTWWLFVLLGILGLLAVNTAACLTIRIARLLAQRKNLSWFNFAFLSTPSAVHFLFCCVMLGHGITLTCGRWEKVPVYPGSEVVLPGSNASLRVIDLTQEHFQSPGLSGRLRRTTIHLESPQGRRYATSHLAPLSIGGSHLFVSQSKKKTKRPVVRCDDDRSIGKAVEKNKTNKGPAQQILVVSDSGLPIIMVSFIAILILMVGYFIALKTRNHESNK